MVEKKEDKRLINNKVEEDLQKILLSFDRELKKLYVNLGRRKLKW